MTATLRNATGRWQSRNGQAIELVTEADPRYVPPLNRNHVCVRVDGRVLFLPWRWIVEEEGESE